MKLSAFHILVLSVLISLLLTACSGGESGTGLGGSQPKVSVGVISGFGSVFVNGVEFDTSDAEIKINDAVATEQDLSIGMVVAVAGSTNRSQVSGKADTVYYESEVCGLVSENNQDGTLTILGQQVTFDEETVFESDIDTVQVIDDIPVGAVVEVSGYRTGDNTLHATHLRLVNTVYPAGDPLTVKGMITTGLASGTFSMGNLTVAVDDLTKFDNIPNQQLTPGMTIKVKSNRGVLNNQLQADTIAPGAGEYAVAGNTFEVEGIVMTLDLQANEFMVNGYTVYFSAQTEFVDGTPADLGDGVKVEVEGVLLSTNQIEAKEISFRAKAKIDLTAPVAAINAIDNQVNVAGVIVQLTNKTLLHDDDKTTKVKRFSLADLSLKDKVKIRAYQDQLTKEIIATQLRRVEAASLDTTFELKGVLDELTNDQVNISGITVDISQITSAVPNEQDLGTFVTVSGTIPVTVQ